MLEQLTKRPDWVMSLKYYYGKFKYRVQLGYFNKQLAYTNWLINFNDPDVAFRKRRESRYLGHGEYDYSITYYTSSDELLQFIIDNHNERIVTIHSPVDDKHSTQLQTLNENTIFRKSLYYKQYNFKMEAYQKWPPNNTRQDVFEIYEYIKENFVNSEDSRCHMRSLNPNLAYNWASIPTVFTTNESKLLFFKLTYSEKLRIRITRVVTRY